MYRSARLPVCGLLATSRYCQNRSSSVDFDRWWSIEGEKGKKKKKRKIRKKKGRRRHPFPMSSSPMCHCRPWVVLARGRKIEV
ncbi:hypothetical protein BHM03_00060328, partial [Ensete ventricosum]